MPSPLSITTAGTLGSGLAMRIITPNVPWLAPTNRLKLERGIRKPDRTRLSISVTMENRNGLISAGAIQSIICCGAAAAAGSAYPLPRYGWATGITVSSRALASGGRLAM